MRMSNEMREIRNQLNTALDVLEEAVASQDVEKAQNMRNEVEKLKNLYAIAEKTFNDRQAMKIDDDGEKGEKGTSYNSQLFYKAVSGGNLSDDEINAMVKAKNDYKNTYTEGNKKDGGYTVPDELSEEIFSSIKSEESVRNLVGVENVNSITGTRIFRKGTANKLYNTAEASEIKAMNQAEYAPTTYKQHKFAGIMSISNELLEDSFVNFINEITSWLAEAARATENAEILYGAGGENHAQGLISTSGAYQEITAPETLTIDFFRAVTLSIKSGYRANSSWTMNSLAFDKISALKDQNGRSFIQPDPRTPDAYMLLGYPINVYDIILTDEDNNTVILFGDAKKAYRMFTRKDLGIEFTNIGAGAFESDTLKAKGIERFDGKVFDRDALAIIRNFVVTPLSITSVNNTLGDDITEASLKNLTKAQLMELVEEFEVTGITESSTKNQIVAAILEKIYPSADSSSVANAEA